MEDKIICPICSYINTPENIEYQNCTNEEGEEHCVFDMFCEGCGNKLYEGHQWGDFDREEALEIIKNKLNLQL